MMDELLSSWLMRLAMANGQKLHTFCSVTWTGKAIWNRDIDKSADAEITRTLSYKTGVSVERARETTLATYEGILFERHNTLGPASWIMPVGIYHRTRRCFGLQYCSQCLGEDKIPYYRRRWRLAFMTVCERHHSLLHDRCEQCGVAVNFHRNELGNYRKLAAESLTLCYACGFDFRESSNGRLGRYQQLSHIAPEEVEFTAGLLATLNSDVVQTSHNIKTYPLLFFAGLRHLLKILAMHNKRIETLRRSISAAYGLETYSPTSSRPHPDFQELSVTARRQLLVLARCLLEDWPRRFIEVSREHKIWSSLWLRHSESHPKSTGHYAPFWFWSVVHEHLYRARYCPSSLEINSAIAYLKLHGERLSNSKLSRLLGVAVIRRGKYSSNEQ